jgi:hypothetical protein
VFYLIVTAVLSINNNNYDYTERERKVIELYSQGKSTPDLAKELRMSLRDNNIILKKHGVNHEIAMIDNVDDNNKSLISIMKKLPRLTRYSRTEKKPIQVAIELDLREKQVNNFFIEFWKLKNLNELYEIYLQIEHCLSSFLKLHKASKTNGLNPGNMEWFTDAIETRAIKIPEIQKQYAKVNEQLEAIDYKKTIAKYQLDDMNNRISYLNKIAYNKRNEIEYLKIEVQELEGYVHGLENHKQQQVQNE